MLVSCIDGTNNHSYQLNELGKEPVMSQTERTTLKYIMDIRYIFLIIEHNFPQNIEFNHLFNYLFNYRKTPNLKPIFHQNAKYLASGAGVGQFTRRQIFALPNAKYTNMLVYFGVNPDAKPRRQP